MACAAKRGSVQGVTREARLKGDPVFLPLWGVGGAVGIHGS
jgi:hypothetical protein